MKQTASHVPKTFVRVGIRRTLEINMESVKVQAALRALDVDMLPDYVKLALLRSLADAQRTLHSVLLLLEEAQNERTRALNAQTKALTTDATQVKVCTVCGGPMYKTSDKDDSVICVPCFGGRV